MPKFDEEKFHRLCELSRIQCDEAEKADLFFNLQKILSFVEQLDEIPTNNVVPCDHILFDVYNVMRDDVVGESLSQQEFLGNVPDQMDGLVRIPPLLLN